MANYSVPANHVGIHAKTLTPNVVDTVTFIGVDLPEIEVLSDGAADIYVCFGASTTPTIAGTQCWRIPAESASATLPVRTSGDTVVKLLSAGAPVYSVSRTS